MLFQFLILFIIMPMIIYMYSYKGFFASGHSLNQFIELNKQIWHYHNNLKATHDYSSLWWTWPLMLRPVWYWVDYQKNTIANIYAMGNPVILWSGLLAVMLASVDILVKLARLLSNKYLRLKNTANAKIFWLYSKINKFNLIEPSDTARVAFVLSAYFAFLLPWAFSPCIMFFYHYLPSIPFLIIILSYFLAKMKKVYLFSFLLLASIVFIYFYPRYIGLPVSAEWNEGYLWLKSWR